MSYSRLALGDRYQIQALSTNEQSVRSIARHLNRSPSTISRELRKRSGRRGYEACVAQGVTERRREGRYKRIRIVCGSTETHVVQKLRSDWSPDQIAGRMRLENGRESPSFASIYRYVEKNKLSGGDLWKHLRILRRQRKDRKQPQWYVRTGLPDRVMITDRPAIVSQRSRLGDYERDSVLGSINGPLFLTVVDRTSRLLKLAWLPQKKAHLVHKATVALLKNEPVVTITNDNGCEFSMHKKTAEELGAKVYFSHAYRAWERGTNENMNGLLRQYFPRKKPIQNLTRRQVQQIEDKINNRPRKCLGYRTPLEIHNQLKASGVALEM